MRHLIRFMELVLITVYRFVILGVVILLAGIVTTCAGLTVIFTVIMVTANKTSAALSDGPFMGPLKKTPEEKSVKQTF